MEYKIIADSRISDSLDFFYRNSPFNEFFPEFEMIPKIFFADINNPFVC